MALHRIRLQSFAPLPSFRVWFLVPRHAVDIQSLKTAISSNIPALKGLDIRSAQLMLELDGFELLDECSINLVRESDIVLVKAREPGCLDKLKRKANVEKATISPKRHRLSGSSKESSWVSSSSPSDSSTSDPSTSDSSTSASSDSDSEDSKSIPGPKFVPSEKNTHSKDTPLVARSQVASYVVTSGVQQPTIPPGFGKASTHSRNKRRKLRRKYEAAQTSSQIKNLILPTGVNEAKMLSVGRHDVLRPEMQSSDQQALPTSVSVIPRSSIQCNNKSNGSIEATKSTASQMLDYNSPSVPAVSGYPTAFIPPSEREDLPKNLFVTSVEINWKKNQEHGSRQDANKVKPRAPPDNTCPIQLFDPCVQHSDWATVEKAWESYKTLNASMELLPDSVVAWKAFGLDPVTLTPQASMLHLGRVVTVDAGIVLVQPFLRANVGSTTFGRTSMDDDQEAADQITRPLQEVWSNEWKLISH